MWTWCLAEQLAEISADLREAVAHLSRVRDDALYESTVTLLTTLLYMWQRHKAGLNQNSDTPNPHFLFVADFEDNYCTIALHAMPRVL